MHLLYFLFTGPFLNVRKVHARYLFVFPSLTKLSFIVQKRQLLDDIIHNQVYVDIGFAAHVLLKRLAELNNLRYVKSLVWVELEHSIHNCLQFS